MSKNNLRIIIGLLIAALIGVAIIFIAFGTGYVVGVRTPKEIVIKNIANTESGNVPVDFSVFWQVWDKLRNVHINGTTTPDRDLVYGAIRGLIGSLKDPNTMFFEPSDSKKFEEDIGGSFGGIGAELDTRGGVVTIVAPLKNGPAERIGLKSGDKILKVNSTSTLDLDINQVVKLIRGEPGTKVILAIAREEWKTSKDFEITREIIIIPTLDIEYVGANQDLAHFKLHSFNANASRLFYEGVLEALFKSPKGMILDLRNNPGGFLEEAVNLSGWFLKRGALVVSEEARSGEKINFYSSGPATLLNMPVVVLANTGSASASEILAGALMDQRGIKLIGERTFGKGTVQELQPLKDGSKIKITIAKWVLPSGKIIEKNGLIPDFEIKLTEEDREKNRDPQLEKAIEILQEQIK